MIEEMNEKINAPVYGAFTAAKAFFEDKCNQLSYVSAWYTSDGLVLFVDDSKVERIYHMRGVSEYRLSNKVWCEVRDLCCSLTKYLMRNGVGNPITSTSKRRAIFPDEIHESITSEKLSCQNFVPVKYWNGVVMTTLAQPDKYLTDALGYAEQEINRDHHGLLFREVMSRNAQCIYESLAYPAPKIVVRAVPRFYQFGDEVDGVQEILEPSLNSKVYRNNDLYLLMASDALIGCSVCKCVSNMREAFDYIDVLINNVCNKWQDWVYQQFCTQMVHRDGVLLPMFVIEAFSASQAGIKQILEPCKFAVSSQKIIYAEVPDHRYKLDAYSNSFSY